MIQLCLIKGQLRGWNSTEVAVSEVKIPSPETSISVGGVGADFLRENMRHPSNLS